MLKKEEEEKTISYPKLIIKKPQNNSTFLKFKWKLSKIKLFVFDVVFAEIT